MSTLQDLQRANLEKMAAKEEAAKEQHGAAKGATPAPEGDQKTRHMTAHMTERITKQNTDNPTENTDDKQMGNTVGQKTSRQTGNAANKPTRQPAGRLTSRTADPSDDRPATPTDFRSVAASIRRTITRPPEKPLYKTVTLKMRPDVDDRIEAHCRDTGRLKQDVIHDAVTLYFSILEEELQEEEAA